MRRLSFLAGLVLLLVTAIVQAQEASEPAESIALMTLKNVTGLEGDSVVVFPFTYSDGIASIEGALLSERVLTILAESGSVRVVDRSMLESVMREQKLSAMGLVDPATSVKVGKLVGARGIVSGSIVDIGEYIEVHARLLKVETGEVIASEKLKTRKTMKTFISPLWIEIDRIKKESRAFKLEFWTEKDQSSLNIPGYRIGDFIQFNFKADQDCYLTIFDFTTSGSINVLFPNAFQRNNKIKAGRVYAFPGEEAGFKIRVKGPPGIERLKIFATTKDIPLFEHDYAVESFRSLDEGNYSVTRDLEVVVESLNDNAWAEANFELRIEKILRSAPE